MSNNSDVSVRCPVVQVWVLLVLSVTIEACIHSLDLSIE